MAGRGESRPVGSPPPPPQRLVRQPLQQAQPPPRRLRVPRRPLRRLPVQQRLQRGLRILVNAVVPLQPASVRFPPDATKGRITGPGGRVSLRRQNGREGIYQIPRVVIGGHEAGGLRSAEEQSGLHERADPLHASPHSDVSDLLAAGGARVRRQSVPPGQPAGRVVRLQLEEQRQDTLVHR